MTLINNAPFAKRTVTLASLVLYLAVASSSLITPALALAASGDPEGPKADDSGGALESSEAESSDLSVSSTAFIMGDVATLLDAKDMDGESSNVVPEKRHRAASSKNVLPNGDDEENTPKRRVKIFSFIFGEEPSSTKRVVETMFPMSWDVPLAPSTHVALASMPRRSLRPCRHGWEHPDERRADLFSLERARAAATRHRRGRSHAKGSRSPRGSCAWTSSRSWSRSSRW